MKNEGRLPFVQEILDSGAKVLVTGELTYVGPGKILRDVYLRDPNSTTEDTAWYFAVDRHILYSTLELPLAEHGVHIIKDRGVTCSVAYQPLQAKIRGENFALEDVIGLPGNAYALAHPPAIIIIVDCEVDTALERLRVRDKRDECQFEKKEILEKLRERYNSQWYRKFFENLGTKIAVVSTEEGKPEDTFRRTIEIFEKHFEYR